MASDPRVTLLKLLAALRDLDEKRKAIYAEMDALLNGGDGIGAKLGRLKTYYSGVWQERYRTPYTFTNHAMTAATLKRFLVAHSEPEIAARMFAFLKNDERFYVNARHDFSLFAKAFNQCVGLPVAADTSADTTSRLQAARGE